MRLELKRLRKDGASSSHCNAYGLSCKHDLLCFVILKSKANHFWSKKNSYEFTHHRSHSRGVPLPKLWQVACFRHPTQGIWSLGYLSGCCRLSTRSSDHSKGNLVELGANFLIPYCLFIQKLLTVWYLWNRGSRWTGTVNKMGRKMPEARVWFEYVKEVHGQLGPEFRQASESEYKPATRLSTDLGTCSTHTDSYLCTDLYSLCTYLWYACIYALTETSSQASDLFRTDSLTGMKSDKPRTC